MLKEVEKHCKLFRDLGRDADVRFQGFFISHSLVHSNLFLFTSFSFHEIYEKYRERPGYLSVSESISVGLLLVCCVNYFRSKICSQSREI